jgi:hypothetical protein
VVDYRHVLHSLRRKPQALLNLVYRDALFPRAGFRRAWEALLAELAPAAACRRMVALLALAHDHGCEAELAAALEAGLEAGRLPTLDELATRFARDALAPPPAVSVRLPAVAAYDALLLAGREVAP